LKRGTVSSDSDEPPETRSVSQRRLVGALKAKHQELQIKRAEQVEEVTVVAPAITPTAPIMRPIHN